MKTLKFRAEIDGLTALALSGSILSCRNNIFRIDLL